MDIRISRWTGAAGVAVLVVTLLVMPLHFVHDAAPPVSVVLTRSVANAVTCVCLLAFLIGLRALAQRRPEASVPAALATVTGTVFVAVTLVADALHVGSALLAGGGVDPTRVGGGAEAALFLLGPTARLLTAVTVGSAGVALAWAELAPRSISMAAYAVALGHLALVPTAWSGTDPANFSSINGWGVAMAGGFFVAWLGLVGVSLLRRGVPVVDESGAASARRLAPER